MKQCLYNSTNKIKMSDSQAKIETNYNLQTIDLANDKITQITWLCNEIKANVVTLFYIS